MEILAASIRTTDHLYASIFMGVDIVTIPLSLIQEWMRQERWMPDEHYRIPSNGLKALKYEPLRLQKNYDAYPIEKVEGDLLDEGLKKFANDWNTLLKK
jgi:transaldolase